MMEPRVHPLKPWQETLGYGFMGWATAFLANASGAPVWPTFAVFATIVWIAEFRRKRSERRDE